MELRHTWIDKVEEAWRRRSIVWLAGVRRVGKTCLCQSLPEIEYYDCELPRVRQMIRDPQSFLDKTRGRRIVLDEVHRLDSPSEVLKIAADHYPETRILATGSSTLGASAKFKDTLAGRKAELWLTPMISDDLKDFQQPDLTHRLLHGGLPPFFLADEVPQRDFQEWMDAYWAKDIQELFRLERRHSFQRFAEMLMVQSGGIFDASRFARACEASRPTITNYLSVLEATFVAHVLRPYSTRRSSEIVAAPKVYGFDTGFVCYYRGWNELRQEDLGVLWEHFVINELHAALQTRDLRYWRDKRGHEIDVIMLRRGQPPIAIECKWSASDFDSRNLQAFRKQYPDGPNYIVASDVGRSYQATDSGVLLNFVSISDLAAL